jgi:hypothetical protein
MYYANADTSFESIDPITPPASTTPRRPANNVILDIFYEFQSSIFNLNERIHSRDDDERIYSSMRTVLHCCRLITREIDSGTAADQKLFINSKSAFSETLETLMLQTRTHVSVKNNVSADELHETTRLLTRIVVELIELVYGTDALVPVHDADAEVGKFNRRRNVMSVNDELITAYENSIANLLQCIWFEFIFL